MHTSEEQEIRKEFQLERVILFSDAVFAIIITIMVLEIKLPEGVRELDIAHFRHAFEALVPKLVAYLISFFIVANFWKRHLKIFSFLRDYNSTLITLNLLFLFTVSLFPFAVTLITDNPSLKTDPARWGINIYISTFFLCTMAQTVLSHYMVSKKATLCIRNADMEKTLKWKVLRINYVLIPVLIILLIALNYFGAQAVVAMYVVSFYAVAITMITKRMYPKNTVRTVSNARKK